MKKEQLKIEGMFCEHCVIAVRKELSKLELNVIEVNIGSAKIEYDEYKFSDNDLSNAIEVAGYKLFERINN
ncbi:MAG: heavy-metal-associated domain-containing protein [Bacteroidetes bacterium]|nr:heavy-metal-associated domain-containing protein [Bacteroidota bacterium]